jgi:hypothetical protein
MAIKYVCIYNIGGVTHYSVLLGIHSSETVFGHFFHSDPSFLSHKLTSSVHGNSKLSISFLYIQPTLLVIHKWW